MWNGKKISRKDSVCHFCNAHFYIGRNYTAKGIVDYLKQLNKGQYTRLPVVFGGGEPAMFVDKELFDAVHREFPEIHIETNGHLPLERFANYTHIIMSPKQPPQLTNLQACHDLLLLYPFINPDITLDTFRKFPCERIYIEAIEEDGYMSKLSILNRDLASEYAVKVRLPDRQIYFSNVFEKFKYK